MARIAGDTTMPDRTRSGRTTGRLVVPFVGGVAATLLIVAGAGQPISAAWVVLAITVGIVLGAVSVAATMLGHQRRPVGFAQMTQTGQARPGKAADPLAHVRVVEEQGRQLAKPCLNCGTPVNSNARRCPACGHKQVYACKRCRTEVRAEWDHCPECGQELR